MQVYGWIADKVPIYCIPSRMWQTATKGVQMKLWEEEREDRKWKNDEGREN